jgi:hypothetical protein
MRKTMNKSQDNKNSIDSDLRKKIELLRSTPERDAHIVSQRRERFMSELEGIPLARSGSPLARLTGLFKFDSGRNKGNSMNRKSQKFVFTTILVVLVAIVMVFGGATATAYASQTALPGDALYPVKTSLELTQVALTGDAYNRAQLYLRFAQRRMDEITKLLEQGRYRDVGQAADEFEFYIQEAMESLQIVLAADPGRGAELSNQVSNALLAYALALKSVHSNAPEQVRFSVEKALLASQDGMGEEIEIIGVVVSISDTALEFADQVFVINELTEFEHNVEIGDTVKVHAILTQDGSMIAREVELAGDVGGDDNGNDNGGDDNGNDNANDDNGNDNGDDNGNDNDDDDNGNDNDGNDNDGNDNGEDNGNDNDDDDGNDNDGNNNDDDDDGNDNDGNDNDDDDDGNDNGGNGNDDDDDGNDNGGNDNDDDDDGNDNSGNDNDEVDDGNDNDGNDNDDDGNDNDK